jgi:upstream-binding transcription factor
VAVLDNEANISAGKAAADLSPSASSAQKKAKRAPARSSKAKAAAAAASAVVDDVAELQGMLERLRLEKEKAEEMVRERDEVIRKKEEEIETRDKAQERLQAELRKVQRAKEFKPTVVRSDPDLFASVQDLIAVLCVRIHLIDLICLPFVR